MERLDDATTEVIEQEIRGRFPEGTLDSVRVLQYGDDPAVEPGQVIVQLTVAEAEGDEEPLDAFHQANRDAIQQLQRDIPERWPQANRFKIVSSRESEGRKRLMMLRVPTPDEPKDGDLTPVMARLGPADLGGSCSRSHARPWRGRQHYR